MVDSIRQLLESDGSSRSLVDPELRLMLRESLRECEALYRAGGGLRPVIVPIGSVGVHANSSG